MMAILLEYQLVCPGTWVNPEAVLAIDGVLVILPFWDGKRPQAVDVTQEYLFRFHLKDVLSSEHPAVIRPDVLVLEAATPYILVDGQHLQEAVTLRQGLVKLVCLGQTLADLLIFLPLFFQLLLAEHPVVQVFS